MLKKPKRLKSAHSHIVAIIENKLVILKVLREEEYESGGDLGNYPERVFVCGKSNKSSVLIYVPYQSALFVESLAEQLNPRNGH